jgi:hypothetical protein
MRSGSFGVKTGEEQGICNEINNPKIRELNKEISRLRKEKRKLAERMERHKGGGKGSQAKALRKKASGIERKIAARLKRREQLPKKVLLTGC